MYRDTERKETGLKQSSLLRVGNMWTVFNTVAQIPRKESGWFSMPLFQAKVCLHFIGPAAEEKESVL